MLTESQARTFAQEWMEAWNSHDLNRIMTHYAEDVVIASPIAATLLGGNGRVMGKAAVQAYFAKGLAAYPDLRFEIVDVLWGMQSIVLYYKNQRGGYAGEYMELDAAGRVVRMVAHYRPA